MDIDDELRSVMQRTQPPEGFAERVLARIEPGIQPATGPDHSFWNILLSPFRVPALRWAMAAALVILIAGALTLRISERRKEIAQGEAAKQQLLLALGVASEKINLAQRMVSEPRTTLKSSKPRPDSEQNRPAERRRRRQSSRAERAAGELMAALRVTTGKIEIAQGRLSNSAEGSAPFGNE